MVGTEFGCDSERTSGCVDIDVDVDFLDPLKAGVLLVITILKVSSNRNPGKITANIMTGVNVVM